jgi:hypothetical protein
LFRALCALTTSAVLAMHAGRSFVAGLVRLRRRRAADDAPFDPIAVLPSAEQLRSLTWTLVSLASGLRT